VTKPKRKTVVLRIDPYQSAAMMAVSSAPEGYELESMKRVGTKATIVYRLAKP
jgi:hypothetical protein